MPTKNTPTPEELGLVTGPGEWRQVSPTTRHFIPQANLDRAAAIQQGISNPAPGVISYPNQADMLRQLYSQQQESQLAALQGRLNTNISGLESQRANIDARAQADRSQADTRAQQAGMRLKEILAARGIGGESITAHTGLQTARLQELSAIDRDRSLQQGNIDSQIEALRQAHGYDEQALRSGLSAQHMQALLQQMNQDEQMRFAREQFQYGQQRDAVGDDRWRQQFEYGQQRDAVGDSRWNEQMAYQRMRDAIADGRWERQWGLEKQQIDQALRKGEISIEQAQVSLQQMRHNLAASIAPPPANVTDPKDAAKYYISNINTIFKRDDYYEDGGLSQRDQWENDIKAYALNLLSSGVGQDVVTEILRSLGIKIEYSSQIGPPDLRIRSAQ